MAAGPTRERTLPSALRGISAATASMYLYWWVTFPPSFVIFETRDAYGLDARMRTFSPGSAF
jgi:hypothetical protein